MDIIEFLKQINPSMWTFLGAFLAAGLAYFSTRNKQKSDGALALADGAVSLMEQYRLANEECQEKLKKCKKTKKRKKKR